MQGLGEGMMLALAGFGVELENMIETVDELTIYISVPEHSYHKNDKNEEMAGMVLAKRFKKTLTKLGVKRLTVKSRIRKGEMWTKEMANDAEMKMKQTLYKSQW